MAKAESTKHLWSAWPAPDWTRDGWWVRDDTTLRTIAQNLAQAQAETIANEHNSIMTTMESAPLASKDRREIEDHIDDLERNIWRFENAVDDIRFKLRA